MIAQAACVPYRVVPNGYQILLITTRKGKWTIPKGIIDAGETPQQTAEKEALEEGGIVGEIEPGEPIGSFTYFKWGELLRVQVFLMRVDRLEDDFEDASFRRRLWFSPSEALRQVRKRIRPILSRALVLLNERFAVSEEGGAESKGSSGTTTQREDT